MVCGDGEYIIYTAMALRNKSFGSAQEFVWASDSSEYVQPYFTVKLSPLSLFSEVACMLVVAVREGVKRVGGLIERDECSLQNLRACGVSVVVVRCHSGYMQHACIVCECATMCGEMQDGG